MHSYDHTLLMGNTTNVKIKINKKCNKLDLTLEPITQGRIIVRQLNVQNDDCLNR